MKSYYAEISQQTIVAQLQQCTHLTHDGDLISKKERDSLENAGLIQRFDGWNIVTQKGVEYLTNLNFIHA